MERTVNRMKKGYIHSFESLAALDGEGIRYAVFLVGCPLRCIYCHNPDTWYNSGAMSILSPEELVKKVSRYKPYFKSEGGVTFIGGEPLLQADFIAETLPLLTRENINYIVDTSGAVELSENVKKVLSEAQSVLLDIKFWDDESYLEYTGCDMKNTLKMLDFLENIGKKTVIRTVVIPGINDNEETLEKYIKYIKDRKCVSKYELLAFHTLGFFKYEKLAITNKLSNVPALNHERLSELQTYVDSLL